MTSEIEWLEWRARGIGASDIAGILGISPWASRYSVWASKVMDVSANDRASNAETMRWGKLLEDAIIAETERRLGITVHGQQTRVTHPEKSWALCTVDGFYQDEFNNEEGLIECKTSSEFSWAELPPYYEAQVQWQLEVCGLKRAWVACLHNGRKLSLWRVDANPDVARKMLDIAERFWADYVCTGIPPEPDGKIGTSDALTRQYGISAPGAAVDVSEHAPTLRRLAEVRADIRALRNDETALENRVKLAMRTAEIGTIDGQEVCSWKHSTRKSIDPDKVRDGYPEVAAACTVETDVRTFRLKARR